MEDFTTVIWIIAIIAAMVFNGVSKARKEAKKHAGQGGKHTAHEAWPSWDTTTAAEMQRQAEADDDSAETAELQPAATSAASLTGYGENTGKTADFMQSERLVSGNSTMAAQGRAGKEAPEHPGTEDDTVAEITEDFDLRKAVIYSEILKPKFDE